MRRGLGQCTVCVVERSPTPRRREGQVADRCVIVDLLGQGGNTEVWRAQCGDEAVALKWTNSSPMWLLTSSETFRNQASNVRVPVAVLVSRLAKWSIGADDLLLSGPRQ